MSPSPASFRYLVTADCTACGACLLTCPSHAFVVGVPLVVDAARCTDCGACVEVCPADAVVRSVLAGPPVAGACPGRAGGA